VHSFGINLHAVGGLDDEAYIRRAAELGFSAVFSGMMEEARQLRAAELIAACGMQYETIHAPFGHINDIWLNCEAGEHMCAELIACVDRCAQVGAGIAVVHLSSGLKPPPVTDIGRARFDRLISHARGKGVRIAFENQRLLANLAWVLETYSAADQVGFCWDCGHEACFTPGREYMPLFGSRLICTHIHDNAGIFDQDSHMLPFDGQIDFTRVADHIRKAGYSGSLMLEVSAACYSGIAADAFLQKAARAARNLAALVDRV